MHSAYEAIKHEKCFADARRKWACYGVHVVGAEPPPSRPSEAYHSLLNADYDSSPRP